MALQLHQEAGHSVGRLDRLPDDAVHNADRELKKPQVELAEVAVVVDRVARGQFEVPLVNSFVGIGSTTNSNWP